MKFKIFSRSRYKKLSPSKVTTALDMYDSYFTNPCEEGFWSSRIYLYSVLYHGYDPECKDHVMPVSQAVRHGSRKSS